MLVDSDTLLELESALTNLKNKLLINHSSA